jgi:hypothetical protein
LYGLLLLQRLAFLKLLIKNDDKSKPKSCNSKKAKLSGRELSACSIKAQPIAPDPPQSKDKTVLAKLHKDEEAGHNAFIPIIVVRLFYSRSKRM